MKKTQNKSILFEYVRTSEKLYGKSTRAIISLILLIGFSFISLVALGASAEILLISAPELFTIVNNIFNVASSAIDTIIGFQAATIVMSLLSKTILR